MYNARKISILVVILVVAVMASRAFAAGETSASYFASDGDLYVSGAGTAAEALAAEDDKFVQLAPGASVVMKFPKGSPAFPDGTDQADLRIATLNESFPAEAEILTSIDGSTWSSLGIVEDTADQEFNLTEPALYVKINQADHYIDPAHPLFGFDLDAVIALNTPPERYAEITNPTPDAEVAGWVEFSAQLFNDDDDDDVEWAVRFGACDSGDPPILGNVGGKDDPYTWVEQKFSAGADTSEWEKGTYCFVFDPLEKEWEIDVRETVTFTIGEPEDGDFCEMLWKPPISLEHKVLNLNATLPIKFFLADCDGKSIRDEAEPELVVHFFGNGDQPEQDFPQEFKRGTGGYMFLALFRPRYEGEYQAVIKYLGGKWVLNFEVVKHGNGRDKQLPEEKLTGQDKDKPGKPESDPKDGKPRGKPVGKPGKDKGPKKP